MRVPCLYNAKTLLNPYFLFMDQSFIKRSFTAKAGALGVLAATSLMAAGCQNNATTVQTSPSPMPAASETGAGSGTPVSTFSSYKDGTYTANGTYKYHSGSEEVTVTLTLKDGTVTDSVFKGTSSVRTSQRFMDMFAENYKPMVMGKKIDEVKLGKVSGSSLTPLGFNDAVEKIKQQAGQSS
jgi:uncharacterized protein with FMN-binding domain